MPAFNYTIAKMTSETFNNFNTYGYKGFSVDVCAEDGVTAVMILDSKKANDPECEDFDDLYLAGFEALADRINRLTEEEDAQTAKGYKWAITKAIDDYLLSVGKPTAKTAENALIKAREAAGMDTLIHDDGVKIAEATMLGWLNKYFQNIAL